MSLPFFPEPTQEEKYWRDRARDFAAKHLRPTAVEDDKLCVFRKEDLTAAAKLGLTAAAIPKKYGGQELSYYIHFSILEELAKASAAFSIVVGVTNLIQGALISYGSEEQKNSYLTRLTSGEWLGAFSLSESQAGSDAAALTLAAKKDGDSYILNGTKLWCSNGGVADLYLVMARTGEPGPKGVSAFLVPATTAGFSPGKQEKKLGLRASTLAELVFENCRIPKTSLIGPEGKGFSVALSQLDTGRIGIGVCGMGMATEALERYYADKLVSRDESLARCFAELQAVKALTLVASRLKDSNQPVTIPAAQVKLLGSDLAMHVSSRVVEAFGERGYLASTGVERLFRDAKALQIVEGTNQIQCLLLTRQLEKASQS